MKFHGTLGLSEIRYFGVIIDSLLHWPESDIRNELNVTSNEMETNSLQDNNVAYDIMTFKL